MIFMILALLVITSGYTEAKTKAIVSPLVDPLPESEPQNPENEVDYGMYEGDMDFGPDGGSASNRNALKAEDRKWKNGEVCYFFEEGAGQINKYIFDYITYATNAISAKSCIRFTKMDKPTSDCIMVTDKRSGCSATVGYVSSTFMTNWSTKYQSLQLGSYCSKGSTIHELMHALGFFHEQSRPDRDDHIKVHFDRISSGYSNNFQKTTTKHVTTLDEPYDYGSIMHYSAYGFSNNGQKTIEPIPNGNVNIGQRRGLSELDVKKLKKHYKCGEYVNRTTTEAPTTTTTTAAPDPCPCKKMLTRLTDRQPEFCDAWIPARGTEVVCGTDYMRRLCNKSCCTCEDENTGLRSV